MAEGACPGRHGLPGRLAARKEVVGMLLKDINAGQRCVVERVDLPFQMERRLEALGMTRQTEISVVNRKGRGILIIKLRGSRFALGEQITKHITVRMAGEPG